MDIELFKKIVVYNNKKHDLEYKIKQIKSNNLKFAREVEVSDYPKYQGFCKNLKVKLNEEQAEKVGNLVIQLLEEELKEVNDYLDKVEIKTN